MTGTEIAHRDEYEQVQPSSELLLWVEEAKQAALVATSLAKTSFVPASLQGKPHDITAAILAGAELGLKPMATLRSIDVIQGTPALRAHAMRGLVQSRGHEMELVESDETHCVMRGRRRVPPTISANGHYEEWQTVTWTIERAKRLGLADKDQWKKQPQTMLVARATGEICRLIASDVLYAMPYCSEEIDRDERPAPAPQRRVTAAEISGTPEPDPAPEADDWPDVTEPGGAA